MARLARDPEIAVWRILGNSGLRDYYYQYDQKGRFHTPSRVREQADPVCEAPSSAGAVRDFRRRTLDYILTGSASCFLDSFNELEHFVFVDLIIARFAIILQHSQIPAPLIIAGSIGIIFTGKPLVFEIKSSAITRILKAKGNLRSTPIVVLVNTLPLNGATRLEVNYFDSVFDLGTNSKLIDEPDLWLHDTVRCPPMR